MNYDYTQLATLAAILRTGSFEAAAAELCITPSAVSQRMRQLEEHMGGTLIERGQPCTGTDAGRRLARHAEAVGLLEADLARDLHSSTPARSRLRIAVNADSLATWVMPALAKLDGLLFDLVIDDQDHSAEWLKRGDVAGAISTHARPLRGCDSIALGRLRYLPCAAPEFCARWFINGLTAKAFRAAPALQFNRKDRLQRQWLKRTFAQEVPHESHQIAAVDAFTLAAISGLGWGMIPEALIGPELQSGALSPLGAPLDIPLYWQVSRIMATPLTPLTHTLKAQAAQVLITAGP